MLKNNLFRLLLILCALLFVSDFVYHRHGYSAIEELPTFFVIFSFISCMITGLIAHYALKPLLSRDEKNKEYRDEE
jgi:hypothetical protein